jgi:hypothetical protein
MLARPRRRRGPRSRRRPRRTVNSAGKRVAEQDAEGEAPETSLPKVPTMEMGERGISFEVTLPPSVFLVYQAAKDNGLIRDPEVDLDF